MSIVSNLQSAFAKTYMYKGDDPFSSHNRIAKVIEVAQKKIILDVGCNTGFIGKALFKRSWKGSIVGIDKQSRYQSKTAQVGYTGFQTINLETQVDKINGTFDAIVFGDVLEHLTKPEVVLTKLLTKLKKNGIVVISLPNVVNLFVRLQILIGQFNYTQRGILDNDHKRFFTLKTAKQMIESSGLSVTDWGITPIPLPILNSQFYSGKPLFALYYLFYRLSKLIPTLLGYQFIFVARKQ